MRNAERGGLRLQPPDTLGKAILAEIEMGGGILQRDQLHPVAIEIQRQRIAREGRGFGRPVEEGRRRKAWIVRWVGIEGAAGQGISKKGVSGWGLIQCWRIHGWGKAENS